MLVSSPRQGLAFITSTSMSMQQPTRGGGAILPAAMPAPADSSFLLLAFTAAVATAALIVAVDFARYNRRHRGLRLPPGPPGWPVVGNLFQVAFSGKLFIHYIRDLRQEYGPILTLRMGERTLVIISSAELVHEALVEKGQEFANRPRESTTRNIFSSNKFTVNSAVYGPEWRSLRRNMVSGMLSTSRLREFRHTRMRAMDRFVARMRSEAAASPDGASVWVLRNARFAVFCILLDMTFGLLDLDEEHIVHIDAVLKRVVLAVGMNMDDYLPFLRPFFWRRQRRALAVRRDQIDTLLPLINRRRAILRDMQRSPPDNNVAAPFSYLDSVLDLRIEGRDAVPSDDELVTLCSEMINGGTDTTATAIEWAMARIVDNPSIQARLYEEIMQQVGDARPVDDKDTDLMPYLQAFVKELLRKHPPTYFALSHAAVQPGSKLAGYDVPTDANLDIFLPTISEDPKLWDRPTEFDPDRFLSGGEKADMTGSAGIRMIPFSAGRRICPGLAMGTTHIALMVARMVQAFEWRAHPSQQPLDFKDKVEFTVVMDRPLLAAVKARNLSF
ncbi:cytochrome P450 77A4-like [Phragmites australis]|uniref:cytochrome P450 77A4-like n=1 Tax=Phragmites australis TaxID=29695 RepID=UPI002D76E42E|nr:cytochrome P450 77A4-like [Phragmites australis]